MSAWLLILLAVYCAGLAYVGAESARVQIRSGRRVAGVLTLLAALVLALLGAAVIQVLL